MVDLLPCMLFSCLYGQKDLDQAVFKLLFFPIILMPVHQERLTGKLSAFFRLAEPCFWSAFEGEMEPRQAIVRAINAVLEALKLDNKADTSFSSPAPQDESGNVREGEAFFRFWPSSRKATCLLPIVIASPPAF